MPLQAEHSRAAAVADEQTTADSLQLQRISLQLIQDGDVAALYQNILDAAAAIMHSDFASLQMLHPDRGRGGELQLLAFRGFNPEAARFWEWVRADSESTCGAALRTGRRVIAHDVATCDFMAGTEDLATYLQTGIQAVQTTPLVSRGGQMLGMISTHWRQPHEPTEQELRLLDVLARQAADLIERKEAEYKLRQSECRKTGAFEAALDCIVSITHEGTITEFNAAAERTFGHRREDVMGRELAATIIPPAYRDRHRAGLARYLETGEGSILGRRLELTALRADGTEFPIELTVTRIPGEGPPFFTAFLRDITEHRRAELATARLAAIVATSDDAIISKDLSGVITSWNHGAERLFGYSAEEIIGQSVTLLIPLDHLDEEPQIIERIKRGEAIEHYETVRRRKDGSLLDISLTVSPLKDTTGRIVGASKIARDITERRRAEDALRESEERFRMLAENMAQFAWTADATGWIYWYNQRWYDYTGTTLDQMQGWGWKQVHHPEHVERVVERIQQSWDTGEPWEDTFPLRGTDGQYRWFLSRARPIRDAAGNVLRWFGTNTDVTEQRELEKQISQQAQALADSNRRKDEFLAMLSHELRNPLAPILNAVQLLKLQQGGTEIQRDAHAMIERQVSQLARLVDDLLEVSRISTGRIHLQQQRIDLRGVVQRAIDAVDPLCGQKSHSLAKSLPDQPVWVYGDPMRLEQVVVNLLNNACKYTDKNGHIWIGLELASEGREPPEECVLRVRDNGIGIAPELLPHIFDLFTQADESLDRSQGGLGIGLSLVQSLVTMHRGRVEAQSTVGAGSEFIVRLPLHALPGAAKVEVAKSVERPPHSLKVLVVDDNVDAAKGMAMLLRASGHETRVAHEGTGAMQAALDFVPQVVLLDIGLPVVNGYEVAKWIRQQPALSHVVLVALTGYGQESDRQLSREAGFDHHLVKPADFKTVQTILSAVAQRPR